jgi:hypothetical protein
MGSWKLMGWFLSAFTKLAQPDMDTSPQILRSLNSASKIAQRKQCPGSAWAEKGLPRIDNPYAEEGTLLHHHDAHPEDDRTGLTIQQRGILTRNEGLRQAFLERELPRLGISPEAKVQIFREREFILLDEEGDPLKSHGEFVPGHPDLIYWYTDYLVAIIFDSKFGRIGVEPAWMNSQLKFYFVAFCDYYSPETVIVAITQPWMPKGNDFHSAEYSAKDAPEFKQELLDDIRATEPANAPRHASVAACTYCAACGQCPVAITALTEFSVQKVAELSPLQLEMLWDDVMLARKVDEAWGKRLRYLAENHPETVPNTELKSTGSLRNADAAAVFRLLVHNDILPGTPEERVLNFLSGFCKFSVSDFEDYLFETRKLTRPAAEAMVKEILGDLLKEKEKSKSLVRKVASVHAGKV